MQRNYPKIDKYVHKILQRTKVLEPGSTDSDAEPQSELHGVRVSRVFIYGLALYITWLLFGAAIVFLDEFLIEITNSCDPHAARADCFLNTGFFNISALYDEPIDCNLLNLLDNATFICYQYTLKLGEALGTAGAFFATGMMFMKLIAVCYVSRHPSTYCNIIMILHICSGTVLSITTAVVVLAVPQLRQILTEGSLIVMFQFIHILISLILVYALFILTVYKKLTTSTQINKHIDYKTGTENTPGATIIPMITLPHEQST